MKKKWIILNKNIGTGNYVAVMLRKYKDKADNSDYILTIYEGKTGYHVCFNKDYSKFKNYCIPYDIIYPAIEIAYPNASKADQNHYALLQAILRVQDNFEHST